MKQDKKGVAETEKATHAQEPVQQSEHCDKSNYAHLQCVCSFTCVCRDIPTRSFTYTSLARMNSF